MYGQVKAVLQYNEYWTAAAATSDSGLDSWNGSDDSCWTGLGPAPLENFRMSSINSSLESVLKGS